jgi:hypothetical protein
MKEAYNSEKLPECTKNPKFCSRNCIAEINILIDKPLSYAKDFIESLAIKN